MDRHTCMHAKPYQAKLRRRISGIGHDKADTLVPEPYLHTHLLI